MFSDMIGRLCQDLKSIDFKLMLKALNFELKLLITVYNFANRFKKTNSKEIGL